MKKLQKIPTIIVINAAKQLISFEMVNSVHIDITDINNMQSKILK